MKQLYFLWWLGFCAKIHQRMLFLLESKGDFTFELPAETFLFKHTPWWNATHARINANVAPSKGIETSRFWHRHNERLFHGTFCASNCKEEFLRQCLRCVFMRKIKWSKANVKGFSFLCVNGLSLAPSRHDLFFLPKHGLQLQTFCQQNGVYTGLGSCWHVLNVL